MMLNTCRSSLWHQSWMFFNEFNVFSGTKAGVLRPNEIIKQDRSADWVETFLSGGFCRQRRACTSTLQAGAHVHAGRLEADAVLQLSSAVALIEAETPVDPEVAPV